MAAPSLALLAPLTVQAPLFLLLFARIGAALMVLPLTGDEAVPGRIRILLALGVTAALFALAAPLLPPPDTLPKAPAAFALLILPELVIGLALGTAVRMLFWAIGMAAALASVAIGLTSALTVDAATGGQVPLLARLATLAALIVCLASGLHHLWFAALLRSYAVFPVGGWSAVGALTPVAIGAAGEALRLALALAAPLLAFALLFNLILGLIARIAPALQIFFIAQPLGLALGLALFAVVTGPVLHGFAGEQARWLARLGLVEG